MLPQSSVSIPLALLAPASIASSGVSVRSLLPGCVPGVATDEIIMVGPAEHVERSDPAVEIIWLFLSGQATYASGESKITVQSEAIARSPVGCQVQIEVSPGQRVVALRIRKTLFAEDRGDLNRGESEAEHLYYRRFADCPAYSEAIKSSKTVSRTILPEGIVPRMAAGTVFTEGPDEVARHRHPMLEQMFVGLKENNCIVVADAARTDFPPFSIVHIPSGSLHGVRVEAARTMHYVWIDYFGTKADQAWLKNHKPILEQKLPS